MYKGYSLQCSEMLTMRNDLWLYVICLKGYDFALQAGLNDWTSACNSDATVSLPNYTRVIKYTSLSYPDPKGTMEYAFNFSDTFYSVSRIRTVRDSQLIRSPTDWVRLKFKIFIYNKKVNLRRCPKYAFKNNSLEYLLIGFSWSLTM